MTHAGGLWQRVSRDVGSEYPQIKTQPTDVDALCMQMVRDPRGFDMIVTNTCLRHHHRPLPRGCREVWAGGGVEIFIPARLRCFEPVHGRRHRSRAKIRPTRLARFLPQPMMLNHLGLAAEAVKIEGRRARSCAAEEDTQDIGGTLGRGRRGSG